MTAEHLFAENKEKQINAALMALITKDMPPDDLQGMEQQFHALRRLVASKAGFAGFTNLPGFREKVGTPVQLNRYQAYLYLLESSHQMTNVCLLISDFLPPFDCSCMLGT